MSKKVYLKNNIAIEPLIDHWYAWPHLISPGTSSLNFIRRCVPIMESYVKNPEFHEEVVKQPEMLGGPFVDAPRSALTNVKELLDYIKTERPEMHAFCNDITSLRNLLKKEANGQSLEYLYKIIPDSLKGYIELFYDLDNTVGFRFYEQLLYDSPFYNESNQGINIFEINDDSREFILSTPRFETESSVYVNIPFNSEGIDDLFKMKFEPQTFEFIREKLNISNEKNKLFKTFFSEEKEHEDNFYTKNNVRIRYFGHACVLFETNKYSLLVDPVISYKVDSDLYRYTFSDLPNKIDYILITHNHQDHVLLETLIQLRDRIGTIIVPTSLGGNMQDPSLKLMFNQIGFNNVIEMSEFSSISLEHFEVLGIPFKGEHSDLDIRSKLCYVVKFKDFKVLFAADSCIYDSDVYKHVKKLTGDIDVIFLGMECEGAPLSWLYGPLMSEKLSREKNYSRRLRGSNFEEAKSLVEIFNPKDVFVYAMGQEPWLNYVMAIEYTEESPAIIESNKLIDYCNQNNIRVERLYGEKELEYIV